MCVYSTINALVSLPLSASFLATDPNIWGVRFEKSLEIFVFSFSLTLDPQQQLLLVYMEIFRSDRPRSNWHKMVLGEFILHQHSQTSHNSVLFRHSICQETFAYFSIPQGEKQSGCLCCLLMAAFFGTSDAVVALWSNPSCSDVSHLEVALLSWWRSLEIKKEHNQATATLTLKYTHNFTHLSFLGEKNLICSDIWCLCHVAIMTVIQACHCRNERRAHMSILIATLWAFFISGLMCGKLGFWSICGNSHQWLVRAKLFS